MPENRLLRPPGIRINHRVNNSLASAVKQQCTPSTPASHILKSLTAAGIPSGGRIQREGMHYHMCSKHAAGQCCASMLNEDTAFLWPGPQGPTHFASACSCSVDRMSVGSARSCCHRCCFSTGSSCCTPSRGIRSSRSCHRRGREQPGRQQKQCPHGCNRGQTTAGCPCCSRGHDWHCTTDAQQRSSRRVLCWLARCCRPWQPYLSCPRGLSPLMQLP